MTLSEITAAMQAWNAIRSQQKLSDLESILSTGNAFSYVNQVVNQEDYLHAYLGIIQPANVPKLVFFVIPAQWDNQATLSNATPQQINQYIQVCEFITETPSQTSTGGLPTQEALARIGYWNNVTTRNTWLTANVAPPNTVFQAFKIPQQDMIAGAIHNSFLALKQNSAATGGYEAEVIVEDISSSITYMDTSLPIPPASPAGLYLLTLV